MQVVVVVVVVGVVVDVVVTIVVLTIFAVVGVVLVVAVFVVQLWASTLFQHSGCVGLCVLVVCSANFLLETIFACVGFRVVVCRHSRLFAILCPVQPPIWSAHQMSNPKMSRACPRSDVGQGLLTGKLVVEVFHVDSLQELLCTQSLTLRQHLAEDAGEPSGTCLSTFLKVSSLTTDPQVATGAAKQGVGNVTCV